MRTLSKILMTFAFVFLIVSISFAQDMKPDAGKLYNEGNSLLKEGNYAGAITKYDAALKIEPDYRIYYQKGIALKKSGKLEDAKDAFEQVTKMKNDFEGGYNALGGVYFSLGNYQEAVNNFEKVVSTTTNNKVKEMVKKNLSYAYAKLGNNAVTDGKPKEAVEYLQKAVENSNYDAAYLSLAKVYADLGEYDNVMDAAQNALKYRNSIGKGGPYYYLGVAYKNKGEKDKAKEMFNEAKTDASYKKLSEYELTSLNN
jgi:tetratricopeptide (TPR) repeat protein